jgi:hypothetical protein
MRLNSKFVLPIILFLVVVVLLVLMFSSESCVPYAKNDLFNTYSMYEGMQEGADGDPEGGDEESKEKPKEGLEGEDGDSIAPQQKPVVSKETEKEKSSNEGMLGQILSSFGLSASGKKDGFEGMYPPTKYGFAPLNGTGVIDKFSHVDNSSQPADCYSAGLSNSRGPLCLTPELIGLLKTRGNNM